jgi:DNA-binding MarR family transcriptional regulator
VVDIAVILVALTGRSLGTATNIRQMARTATPDDELAARLHSAALHLLRRLAQEDRATGVSAPRLSALSVLVFGGPRTIGSLAAIEGVTPPTMTRLVAAMVGDGLVVRTPDETDRRVVRVAASETGRALLLAGRDRRVATLAAMIAPLTAKERRRLEASATIIERMLTTPPA